MKISISPRDNVVSVNHEHRNIDTSFIPQDILSIQYDTEIGMGIVNRMGGSEPFMDFTPYQPAVDAFNAWVIG